MKSMTKNEKFSIRHGYVIRELRYTDIFSHFHLLIEETVGIRWLLGRIILYLSAITLIRKLLLKMKFPHVFLLTLILIDQKSEIIGSASLKVKRYLSNGKLLVELRIGLKKEYRGLGLGSKLIEALIKSGFEENVERIMLYVSVHNKKAIKLYEKYGFEKANRASHDLLIMKLSYEKFMKNNEVNK